MRKDAADITIFGPFIFVNEFDETAKPHIGEATAYGWPLTTSTVETAAVCFVARSFCKATHVPRNPRCHFFSLGLSIEAGSDNLGQSRREIGFGKEINPFFDRFVSLQRFFVEAARVNDL